MREVVEGGLLGTIDHSMRKAEDLGGYLEILNSDRLGFNKQHLPALAPEPDHLEKLALYL